MRVQRDHIFDIIFNTDKNSQSSLSIKEVDENDLENERKTSLIESSKNKQHNNPSFVCLSRILGIINFICHI